MEKGSWIMSSHRIEENRNRPEYMHVCFNASHRNNLSDTMYGVGLMMFKLLVFPRLDYILLFIRLSLSHYLSSVQGVAKEDSLQSIRIIKPLFSSS